MNTTRGSFDEAGQDELDALLAHAPRYAPPAGFAERVMAALHEQQEAPAPVARPFYLRPYTWATAAAACIAAALCLLPLLDGNDSADALAVDDSLLVEEVLDSIDDPDLISAICCVSTRSYSISTGGGSR